MFVMCAMDYQLYHGPNSTTVDKKPGLSLVQSVVAGSIELAGFVDFFVAVDKVGFVVVVDFVEIGPCFDYGLVPNRVPNPVHVRDDHGCVKNCYQWACTNTAGLRSCILAA